MNSIDSSLFITLSVATEATEKFYQLVCTSLLI